MTREEAKKAAQSRDCSCVNGQDRDSNYHDCIDAVFDHFERQQRLLTQDIEDTEVELWSLWLRARIPHLAPQSAYLFWVKQALQGIKNDTMMKTIGHMDSKASERTNLKKEEERIMSQWTKFNPDNIPTKVVTSKE